MNTNSNKSELSDSAIDEQLASQGQQSMRLLIKSMPEDMPSLAWRSELNAKLSVATGKSQKRRRVWMVLSPSFGLVATAALCFALFAPRHNQMTPQASPRQNVVSAPSMPSLEDQLVASHTDSVTSQDVVGSGLTAGEVQQSNDDPDAQDSPSS